MFIQGDMDNGHFGVDDQGRTVLMGFGSISFLPESFGTYVLQCTDCYASLSDTLGWAGASNMDAMVEIAANLGKTGNPTLGASDLFCNSDRGREFELTDVILGLDENGKNVNKTSVDLKVGDDK